LKCLTSKMNMTVSTENPYQSPQTVIAEPRQSPPQIDWKSILKRWEILRIPYNLIVGLAGLLTLAMIPPSLLPHAVGEAIVYGLVANVMYLLGPVTELYLNWFVDAWEDRSVPEWVARFVRSAYLTALLFVGGSLFSVGLTLLIGVSHLFAIALPNQQ
jgi:hypothetical protein